MIASLLLDADILCVFTPMSNMDVALCQELSSFTSGMGLGVGITVVMGNGLSVTVSTVVGASVTMGVIMGVKVFVIIGVIIGVMLNDKVGVTACVV